MAENVPLGHVEFKSKLHSQIGEKSVSPENPLPPLLIMGQIAGVPFPVIMSLEFYVQYSQSNGPASTQVNGATGGKPND